MQKTLAELARMIDGEVVGDQALMITGLSGIQEAKEGDLTFLANSKYIPFSQKTKASAIIVTRDMDVPGKSTIRVDNPSLAFANLISMLVGNDVHPFKGVHASALIAPDAVIGKNVSVGPFTVIESQASIGDNTVIYAHSYIGHHARVGAGCLIYPNITVRERVVIGDRVIIHSGTVVGSDGFGFIQVDGVHRKIPQVGTVVIEDDVEIGANVTIDRARFDQTVIGRGTKIDNLVQIAHNVTIGENCIIIAQVGISGSVKIGKGAILAGQAGITGHLTVGDGAVVLAQSAVAKSVPGHTRVSGSPSRPHHEAKRVHAYTQRLPCYVKTIKDLEKKVQGLEVMLKHSSGRR
jgi:UDP-3-O-[3-hydroxymyristoyl] glucosamine N-acyltransferase